MRWTAEMEKELIRLRVEERMNDFEIAKEMGITSGSVHTRVTKLLNEGVIEYTGANHWSEAEDNEIYRLRDVERISSSEIAKVLGRKELETISRIRYLINKGICKPYSYFVREHDDALLDLRKRGYSVNKAAKELNLTKNQVKYTWRRMIGDGIIKKKKVFKKRNN